MSGIDKYAYQSKLAGTKASGKLISSVSMMLICIVFSSNVISLMTIALMSAATLILGGCRPKTYLLLLLVPFTFLVTGVITIIVNRLPGTEGALLYFRLFGGIYGISLKSLSTGLNLFLKSMGAVCCLYFFSLNTPMNSFLSLLRRHVPGVFVELMELIYRFIFIIWDESRRIYTAQDSRLGYRGFANSMKSLGELVTTVFIRALRRADRISVALDSRGFDGNFDYLLEEENPSVLINVLTILCSLAFVTIGILERLRK